MQIEAYTHKLDPMHHEIASFNLCVPVFNLRIVRCACLQFYKPSMNPGSSSIPNRAPKPGCHVLVKLVHHLACRRKEMLVQPLPFLWLSPDGDQITSWVMAMGDSGVLLILLLQFSVRPSNGLIKDKIRGCFHLNLQHFTEQIVHQ